MNDEREDRLHSEAPHHPSRRDFVAASAAVGLAAASGAAPGAAAAAERQVVETDVEVKTADGTCDAAFFHPVAGTHPGVLIWTDVFGLRPAFRHLGRRLAAQGYAVLVPNPFYRTARAPVVVDASSFNFDDPAERDRAMRWSASVKVPGAIERDAQAHTAFLDAQPQTDRTRKLGTHGYCMGGPL